MAQIIKTNEGIFVIFKGRYEHEIKEVMSKGHKYGVLNIKNINFPKEFIDKKVKIKIEVVE